MPAYIKVNQGKKDITNGTFFLFHRLHFEKVGQGACLLSSWAALRIGLTKKSVGNRGNKGTLFLFPLFYLNADKPIAG